MYDDSRGRHVRPEVVTYKVSRDGTRTLSLDSTRLAPEAWLGIASYVHQVQTCSRRLVFCLYAVINSIDQIRSLYGGASREVAIRFPVPWALRIVIWVGFWSSKNWPLRMILVLIELH